MINNTPNKNNTENNAKKENWKNVWLLSTTSLLNDLSKTLLMIVLPFYYDSLGFSKSLMGLIEGLMASIGSLANFGTGYLSDKTKNARKYAIMGYALLPIARLLLIPVQTLYGIIFLRTMNGIGEGMKDAPRDVILTNSVNKENRGKAYGIHRTLHQIGAVIGTIIAFFFITSLTFQQIFLIAGIAVFAGVIILFFVKEKGKENGQQNKTLKTANSKENLMTLLKEKNFRNFITISAIFSLANIGVFYLMVRVAELVKTGNIEMVYVPFIYLLFPLTFAITAYPMGWLSDKISRKNIIIAGYILFAFLNIGIVFANSLIPMMLIFGLYGLFWSSTHAMLRAFTTDIVGVENRGKALGLYHAISGLFVFPGYIFAGMLWDNFGYIYPFIFASTIGIVCALLMFVFVNSEKID
ncbi:MAG: hypothetical protein CVT88_06740 [Candidatus Altiarchaeales archaeon HGW-Altiarchaeales-1]|nr:MAG: hypothetical protein CVT88_06740 [Candidatus Altiarchaeales archaeon HGW-Altiarchaeales-1]